MRFALVLAAVLALPASADAYVKLAPVRLLDPPTILGSEVLVPVQAPTGATLTAYSLDGGARPIAFAAPTGRTVFSVGASPSRLTVITGTDDSEDERPASTPELAAFTGPPGGPLQPFRLVAGEVVASGDTLLTIERRGVYLRAGTAKPQRLLRTRKYNDAQELRAAGRFVSYVSWVRDPEVVVHALPSGREVYRVPYEQDYALTTSGRVVVLDLLDGGNEVDDWPTRVMVASRAHPKPRPVRRLRLHTPFLAAAGNRIVVVERAGELGRLVTFGFGGRNKRAISAPMNDVRELAYDGKTLAFGAGLCTYAGPLPAQAPPLPADGCFDVAPQLDDATRVGDHVDVSLKCVAPPGAQCRATLRLRGDGDAVLLEQDIAVAPGRPVQRLTVTPGTTPLWIELVRDGHVHAGGRILEG